MDYDFDMLLEAFEYLDDLRESGSTNMFGASTYVSAYLGHDKTTARQLVSSWMKTFDGVLSVENRVAKALETL